MQDPNCIFCKIVARVIPSYKVYEDENFFGFLSAGPINEGHTLIIPKQHFETFLDLPDDLNKKIFAVVQQISKKINQVFSPKKIGVLIAGWDVPHTHIHIVPMHEYHDLTSEKTLNKTMPQFTPEEKQQTLDKIKF